FLLTLSVLQPDHLPRRLLSVIVIVGAALIALAFNRRGRIRTASWILIVGLMATVTARSLTTGGLSGPAVFLYLAIVAIAGLLLDLAGAVIVGAAVALV